MFAPVWLLVVFQYLAECGGDVEQAVMRWMGHAEVMGEIVASWASLGDFPPEIDEPVDSVPKSSEESTGGGEGGGSGKEEEDGGTGGGVASKAAAHERRQEAIGKILSRERRLGAELQNLQKGSKLNVEVSLCGDALDHWIVKSVNSWLLVALILPWAYSLVSNLSRVCNAGSSRATFQVTCSFMRTC